MLSFFQEEEIAAAFFVLHEMGIKNIQATDITPFLEDNDIDPRELTLLIFSLYIEKLSM